MNKHEYFVAACNNGAFRWKHWVLSVFSHVKEQDGEWDKNMYPYRFIRKGKEGYFVNEQKELVRLDFEITDDALFGFKEKCTAKAGDAANLTATVETTYGRLLYNWICICWALAGKIDYQNDAPINVKAIESIIETKLVDTPIDMATATDRNVIYVFEYLRFIDAHFNALTGYSQLCVPSATRKTMTRDPRTVEFRNKLLADNKDRLHDPATIAKIQKELADFDREWMKGDQGMGFMINPKAFDTIRMKTQLMQGAEMGFGGVEGMELIPTSLSEGWDVNSMPAMINSIRSGSYDRGADTALGGAEVKTFYRLFQNAKITVDDCGTTLGVPKLVLASNIKKFVGYYHIVNGKPKPIDESCIGKIILARTPGYCKAEGTDFCKCCMGDLNAQYPAGLPGGASDVGNQFMYMFMKAMHGKALKTAQYDFTLQIK